MPRFARVYFTFNRFLVKTSFPEGAFCVGGRFFFILLLLLLLVVVVVVIIHGFERVQRFFPRGAL